MDPTHAFLALDTYPYADYSTRLSDGDKGVNEVCTASLIADRLLQLAELVEASNSEGSAFSLDVFADGYEIALDAEEVQDNLDRIVGDVPVEVLNKAIQRAKRFAPDAVPSFTNHSHASLVGGLLEQLSEKRNGESYSLAYIARSPIAGRSVWEAIWGDDDNQQIHVSSSLHAILKHLLS